jgi:diguanylate cyclase (GGDEF)-like protein
VCSATGRPSTCQPLLVGGEVIGSVLVEHDGTIDDDDRRRIRQSVAQASPVLGNLRNLAVAEFRANSDSLTGVANKRAADDTLKRLAAIASRTVTPLGAILLDLDHFKQLNDVYGHDKGDEALAAASHAMRSALRDSDFIGRFGGEEFLVLLPDTDAAGAMQVAENLRKAVESVTLQGVDRSITASFGVAVMPDDAGEPSTLIRKADRALYAAKAAGRNRVELTV